MSKLGLLCGFLLVTAAWADQNPTPKIADSPSTFCSRQFRNLGEPFYLLEHRIRQVWAGLSTPSPPVDFNFGHFERARSQYEKLLADGAGANLEAISPVSFEERAAFLEVAFRTEIVGPLNSGEILNRKAVLEAIKTLGQAKADGTPKPWSKTQIREVFTELYRQLHGHHPSLQTVLNAGEEQAFRAHLLQRFENELARSNAESVFARAGLLGDPTLREKFKEAIFRNEHQIDRAFTLIFNLPFVLGTGLPPMYLPKGNLLGNISLPPALRIKIIQSGPDSVYSEIRDLYKIQLRGRTFDQADFDFKWQVFRKIYSGALVSYFAVEGVQLALNNVSMHTKSVSEIQESTKALEKIESAIPSAEDIGSEVIEAYKSRYQKQHGNEALMTHLKSPEFEQIRALMTSH